MLKKNQPRIRILFSVIVLHFLTSLTGDKFCLIYARRIRKPLIAILAFLSTAAFMDVKEQTHDTIGFGDNDSARR